MVKLILLNSAGEINHSMSLKARLREVELPLLQVKRQQKQIWVRLESRLHNQQQILKVRQECLDQSQELQHQLQNQLLVKNPLNLPLQVKKLVLNLQQQLQQKDKEGIKRFKNNPLTIKFLALVHLAVKKLLQFSNRSLLKLALRSNQNQGQLLLEQAKLSQQLRNLQLSLPYSSKKAL